MNVPSDFFTVNSLSTLVGLTGVTFVVTNALSAAFGLQKPWIGLGVAIAATEAGVYLSNPSSAQPYVFGILNGCLVFLTATGSAGTISGLRNSEIKPHSAPKSAMGAFTDRFFERWF